MPARRLPPLHAIRAFEAAARHLSMTRAAEELKVTAGAVSRHVRSLEIQMETVLFQRRSTGLVLTPAGEALAEVARSALDGLSNAVNGLRLRRFRRLSIGAYGFFISRALLPRWKQMRVDHPDLEVDLHTSSNALDLVLGRFDAVIAVSDGGSHSGIITHRLLPIATVPVCSPAWLENGEVDFATIPLLHARPRPDDWQRWLDHAGFGAVGGQAGSSFESLGLAIDAAAAGMGCAIAIEGLLPRNLARSGLVRAHGTVRPTRRHFVLQYESRLVGDPAMNLFKDWLVGQME
ncbi:MAG: LysR family transcriptional regulator [Hyphomicrobiaceae bacterium]|nr:LysR family transcriptional regulator [Hyphomicrobiaceae bacterium]